MRYSPVGNVHLLQRLNERQLIGDYLLLLAHHVVEFPNAHKLLLAGMSKEAIVILDNSLIELGGAVDFSLMEEAVKIARPNYIVLPDVLLDRVASVAALKKEYTSWVNLAVAYNAKLLAVVQGAGYDEMFVCAHEYMEHDAQFGKCIGALGIPRKFATVYGSRQQITRRLWGVHGLPMHMMGFSNNLLDDLKSASLPGVMGIDSATPLRLGYENTFLEKDYSEKDCIVARETYFKEALEITDEMLYNIAYVRGALDGLHQQRNASHRDFVSQLPSEV